MTTTTLQSYVKVSEYDLKQKKPLTTANSLKNPLTIASSSANTPTKTPKNALAKKIQRLLFNIEKENK